MARRNGEGMEGRHLSTFQGSSKVEARTAAGPDFFMLADEVIPA